jgi:hypothetical protein
VAVGQPATVCDAIPIAVPSLADPFLALAADVLDDIERVRIANENRLRQLTRTGPDADGVERGFGLDESHPDVARLAALVDALAAADHQATLNLQRMMRRHPLWPWAEERPGIGAKQFARLLASIGDPYMRPEMTRKDGDAETIEPSRPRMVSELWAFAGLHVTKTPVSGHEDADGNGGAPGHASSEAQTTFAGVAPKRTRGQRSNWSGAAKMRVFLIAESCIKQAKSPYRPVYEEGRARYADAVHDFPCPRCGPAGNPAPAGSPLSAGHQHARAMRLVMKEILRDLWTEAKRLHTGT